MRTHVITDAGTGDVTIIPFTDEENAAADLAAQPSILDQIAELEKSITDRRWREAFLTGDKSFIESVDAQIAALRKQL